MTVVPAGLIWAVDIRLSGGRMRRRNGTSRLILTSLPFCETVQSPAIIARLTRSGDCVVLRNLSRFTDRSNTLRERDIG